MGRTVDQQELEHVLQFLAGEVPGHQRASGRRIHHAGAERRHGEHVVDRLHARLSRVSPARIIPFAVNPMSAFVALRNASVQRLARIVPAAMSVNVLGMSRGATASG